MCGLDVFGTDVFGTDVFGTDVAQRFVAGAVRPGVEHSGSARSGALRARRGRLVQAHVVGGLPTPRFCADPHFLGLLRPETGGWYRQTWLTDVVGTRLTPRFCADPHFLATAAARNERLVQTEAVGGVEAVVAPGVGDQKGEVGTGTRGWHAANSQILCTPPLSGTAWQPETGGWYGRTWLPTPTFCDLDPAAGGLRRHHVSARPLSQSRRDPIREADATVRHSSSDDSPTWFAVGVSERFPHPTSDDGKGKAVSFGLLPDWARA